MLDEIKTVIRDHWNQRAAAYDASAHHTIEMETERAEWASLLLAAMGHQVTGADIAEDMLAQARAKAAARSLTATFLIGDAEAHPFPDASFDVVVNRHLLWTRPDPERALFEWTRVLAPGGKMVIIDGDFHCAAKTSSADERASPSMDAYRAAGIADRLPLQASPRPQADLQMPAALGLTAEVRIIGSDGEFFVDLPFGARQDHCRFALFGEKPL
ncbi:hypothetical protein CCR94_21675 [Rhodoblastus sphagnicola]|uniref:Methyltransferase type 11 domain-containing protein n=1 Tax=Rhodoblastus sphagnicola TaxID=333368 RepID=A0A2S6MWJ0_9HYPH|nr:class I SAM-dependent methyltransferase [Rhodoblastus sphagnicola]MBB4200009.1 ubiquinone/menaquinone biosynthesis C-methylase UbiE [Rhodoblastus sphagnicola]PPQ26722.1 hypothetical protein CCR94_21675 [Rhodoblastus sphagnicola]